MRISDWSSDVCSSDLPKKQEYRVHVLNGKVVDVQRKARVKDFPDDKVNWKIRNHDNGFIYARDEKLAEVPKKVLSRSEEHTSELQSLMRISYAVFCLKKKIQHYRQKQPTT